MIGKFLPAAIIIAAILIGTEAVGAQKRETGFLNRSVTVGSVEYRYQVFVPREFNRKRSWPVILALHGGGEYGRDGLRQTNVGLAPAIRRNVERFPAIVIFPQAKADGNPGWQMDGGKAAIAALDRAVKEFRGDAERVSLTGFSAGGNGAWFLAAQYPARFAALIPVCAFVTEFRGRASNVLYPPLSTEPDLYAAVARSVASIPIWIFHGDADDVVPPEESRRMFVALKRLGADVTYTELAKVNHNAWDPAYGRADLIAWMLKQRRR